MWTTSVGLHDKVLLDNVKPTLETQKYRISNCSGISNRRVAFVLVASRCQDRSGCTSRPNFGRISRNVLSILHASMHSSWCTCRIRDITLERCDAPRTMQRQISRGLPTRETDPRARLRANEAVFRRGLGIARISNPDVSPRIASKSHICGAKRITARFLIAVRVLVWGVK